jgi:hypothetical protein
VSGPLLLSPDELVAITGYRRPRDQVAWVAEHYAVRAFVNAAGEAVVLRAHIEAATGTTTATAVPGSRVRMVREVAR